MKTLSSLSVKEFSNVRSLVDPAWRAALAGCWGQIWMGPASGTLVIILALAARTPTGQHIISDVAIVHAGDPLTLTIARLPLSMFAPAALLPFWFAVVQVLLVFSLAQALLGVRRTFIVAFCGHTMATLSAQVWIAIGPPIGIPVRFLFSPDAGPSAAVLALIAYIVVRRRQALIGVLVSYHLAEISIFNGLTQREHLVGALTGAATAISEIVVCTHLSQRSTGGIATTPIPLASEASPLVDIDASG